LESSASLIEGYLKNLETFFPSNFVRAPLPLSIQQYNYKISKLKVAWKYYIFKNNWSFPKGKREENPNLGNHYFPGQF
jgi:hypothetical protein